MAAVVSLDSLLADRRLWRGQSTIRPSSTEPTGYPALDAALPTGGWPEAALIEILLPADGLGELQLVLPALARHTQAGRDIAVVTPPYVLQPRAWQAAGVALPRLHRVDADARHVLWATEQCLRAGCLAAVLCWPRAVDDKALRRLQVAAESGRSLLFVFRDQRAAANPSPAALRLQIELGQLRVLKCRGGLAPTRPVPFTPSLH